MANQHTGFTAQHLVHALRGGILLVFDVAGQQHAVRGHVSAGESLLLAVKRSDAFTKRLWPLPSRLAICALSIPRSLNRSAVVRDQIASGIRWYATDADVIKLDRIA
jgi:hypothetical protein